MNRLPWTYFLPLSSSSAGFFLDSEGPARGESACFVCLLSRGCSAFAAAFGVWRPLSCGLGWTPYPACGGAVALDASCCLPVSADWAGVLCCALTAAGAGAEGLSSPGFVCASTGREG